MQPPGACCCTTHGYHHGTVEISTESKLSVRQGTWVKGLEPRVGGCHREGLERAPHLPAGDASSQMSIRQSSWVSVSFSTSLPATVGTVGTRSAERGPGRDCLKETELRQATWKPVRTPLGEPPSHVASS